MRGDGLPENICLSCSQQVNTAYLFKRLCERSDLTLRDCTNFTDLSSDQNTIFTIQIESSKFDLILEDKSLSQLEHNEKNIENETCGTILGRKLNIFCVE